MTIDYKAVLQEASKAANEAGEKWVEQRLGKGNTNPPWGTMMDVCGFCWLQWTDRRSKFYRWVKANDIDDSNNFFHVPYKYSARQDLGLKEACMSAALKVLIDAGITGLKIYSRVD